MPYIVVRLTVLAVFLVGLGSVACSDTSPPASGGAGNGSGGVAGAGGAVAGSPSGGSAGMVGMGGAMTGAGAGSDSGGSADSAGGGGGGTSATAGAGGATGGSAAGDTPPWRPLAVKAAPARHEHTFMASAVDAEVSFNDNSQIAVFDNRAPKLLGKLVLPFGGAGSTAGSLGGQGEFCARRGFHVLAIAAFQDYNILIGDPDFYGDARREVFEGVTYTTKGDFANVKMGPADGVARRTQKALAYLHGLYPDEDWGYYLQPDGSVRWSDVIFTGMSHGASNAARFAMLVRAWRAVSISGPRDNTCANLNPDDCGGVVAKWFDEKPQTPVDRFFAITGKKDAQHTQHLYAMQRIGYVGEPIAVQSSQPPYGGSHRFVAEGGHEEYCGQAAYDAACNIAFDVPQENQAGVK